MRSYPVPGAMRRCWVCVVLSLALHGQAPDTLNQARAILAQWSGNPSREQQRQLLRKLRAAAPDNAAIHAEAGEMLLQRGEHELALAELLLARKLGANDAGVTLRLATLENLAGAFEDSVRECLQIQQRPGAPDRLKASAAAVAGISLEGLGRFDEARKQLELAVRLAPNLENAHIALGGLLARRNEHAEAVKALAEAARILPNSPAVEMALGSALLGAGLGERAAVVLANVARRAPTAEAYGMLAQAQMQAGQATEATQTLRALASRQPSYPMLHMMLAQALLAQSPPETEEALRELAAAEAASPEDAEAPYLKGKALLGLGRFEAAAEAFRKALDLRPEMANWRYQLGVAYQKSGQQARADEEFARLRHLRAAPSEK